MDGEPAGLVAVADVVRDESREAVERLHALGLEVAMLTGDNRRTAEAIARELGIDRVVAEVRPEDKAERGQEAAGRGQAGRAWSGTASTTPRRSRRPT